MVPVAALDPTRLSVADAARLLGVEELVIRQDLEAGLPANPDGTVNLVYYATWLNVCLRGGDEFDGEA